MKKKLIIILLIFFRIINISWANTCTQKDFFYCYKQCVFEEEKTPFWHFLSAYYPYYGPPLIVLLGGAGLLYCYQCLPQKKVERFQKIKIKRNRLLEENYFADDEKE